MRCPPSEKLEIIRLVERSHLPVRRTLDKLGIPTTTFYRWYDRYGAFDEAGLEDRNCGPGRVWNRIPDDIRGQIVELALDEPELSPRELAVTVTDAKGYFRKRPSTACSRPTTTSFSPYLLIHNPAGTLPGSSIDSEISFAQFKTIAAQDIVKMITAFTDKCLSEPFQSRFQELRSTRNKIMHSIGKEISIEPAQLIEILLEVHSELFPDRRWPSDRMQFLDRSPVAHLGAVDFTRNRVCWELEIVLNFLKPSKVKKFFSIEKDQRRYSCPSCLSEASRDAGFEHRLAVLTAR